MHVGAAVKDARRQAAPQLHGACGAQGPGCEGGPAPPGAGANGPPGFHLARSEPLLHAAGLGGSPQGVRAATQGLPALERPRTLKHGAVVVAQRERAGRHDLGDGAEPEHLLVLEARHVGHAVWKVAQRVHDLGQGGVGGRRAASAAAWASGREGCTGTYSDHAMQRARRCFLVAAACTLAPPAGHAAPPTAGPGAPRRLGRAVCGPMPPRTPCSTALTMWLRHCTAWGLWPGSLKASRRGAYRPHTSRGQNMRGAGSSSTSSCSPVFTSELSVCIDYTVGD